MKKEKVSSTDVGFMTAMKAPLALLLPALVAAYPGYVKCDLTGSQTAADLTVATTIMGGAVVDSAAIAAPSGTTYSANTVLTWTWDQALLTQGFVKASDGTITGLSGSTARTDCVAPAVAQYSSASRAPPHPHLRRRPLALATRALRGVPSSASLAARCYVHGTRSRAHRTRADAHARDRSDPPRCRQRWHHLYVDRAGGRFESRDGDLQLLWERAVGKGRAEPLLDDFEPGFHCHGRVGRRWHPRRQRGNHRRVRNDQPPHDGD